MVLAAILLDYRQWVYAYQLLSLPDPYPAKQIISISLKKGDRYAQPEELPIHTLLWMQNSRPILYGQWWASQLTLDHFIDPAEGVEPVEKSTFDKFKANISIKCKIEALKKARKDKPGCALDRQI